MSRKIDLSAAAQAVQAQEICQPVGVQPANPHHAGCDRYLDETERRVNCADPLSAVGFLADVIAAEGWQVTS